MPKGFNTNNHPGRKVSRDAHMDRLREQNSFVGTFHGTDNGRGYFSAESTGAPKK